MGERLCISRQVLHRIAAETAESPCVEACGLLFGNDDRITAVQPCRNVAADPATRFEIDPAALLAAHRNARLGGPTVIGCYHSHPTGWAEPSPRDAADAAPDGSIWLIAAVDDVTAWRATPNGALHGRFDAIVLLPTHP